MAPPALVYRTWDTPPADSLQAVDAGLEAHNHAVAPLGDVLQLATFASEPCGRIAGGAVGRTWGRCCELLQLWVDPARQREGIGSRLLADFEAGARARGCDVFYLTTLSFQAPDFYRRRGYDVAARISGYPDGIIKYLMQKAER